MVTSDVRFKPYSSDAEAYEEELGEGRWQGAEFLALWELLLFLYFLGVLCFYVFPVLPHPRLLG